MITITPESVTVNFAKDKTAGVIATESQFYQLILQEMIESVPVGEIALPENTKQQPKIVMNFNCIESIDVMIKHLERIRFNLSIPFAC